VTPKPADDEAASSHRQLVKPILALVLLAALVSFVVQNGQKVKVQLWFVSGHPRLIWVLLVTVAVGAILGFIAGRPGRRRRADGRRGRRR
jgi:uncharacterized integral membrane protein